jgi:hypothetical protein
METEQVEHKASLAEWREIVETVAAFAANRGGLVRPTSFCGATKSSA